MKKFGKGKKQFYYVFKNMGQQFEERILLVIVGNPVS